MLGVSFGDHSPGLLQEFEYLNPKCPQKYKFEFSTSYFSRKRKSKRFDEKICFKNTEDVGTKLRICAHRKDIYMYLSNLHTPLARIRPLGSFPLIIDSLLRGAAFSSSFWTKLCIPLSCQKIWSL